jgi:hypothetical protein
MKTLLIALLAISMLITIIGCTGPTPIKDLVLPPYTIIEGTIIQIDDNGFALKDISGSIYVKAKLPEDKKLNFFVNEKVKVYGNLQGGPERMFDGYVIEKSSGEQIIITTPTPNSRFIFQNTLEPTIMINPNIGIINPGAIK